MVELPLSKGGMEAAVVVVMVTPVASRTVGIGVPPGFEKLRLKQVSPGTNSWKFDDISVQWGEWSKVVGSSRSDWKRLGCLVGRTVVAENGGVEIPPLTGK